MQREICGTCKLRKTDGQIHMVHNGDITDEDIEENYILACCFSRWAA